ncbi:MAG: response regulator transcription factor [Kiritimatiellae bacterium]|nr:response regulator transcription factor [Kiritimatiellia bacterium]
MKQTRLLIADDHAILRDALKQILDDTADMRVTGEAASGPDAVLRVRHNDYDVVLLDICMPGNKGLEAVRQIREIRPKLPILVLSMYGEEQYGLRALRAGASAYVTKESGLEQLVEAIRTIAKGRKYVSPELAAEVATAVQPNADRRPHELLSDREYQVLLLIAQGRTVGQIAADLSLSPKTVSTYRVRILEKMGLKTNAELMRYALVHGLS